MPRVKKQAPPITIKAIEAWVEFRGILRRQVFTIARRYFNTKKVWFDELKFDDDQIRAYPDGKISVHAYHERSLEETVEIPVSLLVNLKWEAVVDKWIKDEAVRYNESKKFRELRFVREIALRYPKEIEKAVREALKG
jgi:hypothetical protein